MSPLEPSLPLPTRVIVPDHVLTQTVDGQAVLLDMRGEHYYSLDPVGTEIWNALAGSPEVGAVLERMLATYDVDEARLRQDVAALLDRLAAAGLVTLEP